MCIQSLDLAKINLDDDNEFDEDDPKTIIHWLSVINCKTQSI